MLALAAADEAHALRGNQLTESEAAPHRRWVLDAFAPAMENGGGGRHFPGSTPISMMRADLPSLAACPHLVSLKADGVRYFLVLTMEDGEPIAMLCNRNWDFFEIAVCAAVPAFQEGCLFDAELVVDGSGKFTLLVFDAIVTEGKSLCRAPYEARLKEVAVRFECPRRDAFDSVEAYEQHVLGEGKVVVAEGNVIPLDFAPKPFFPLRASAAVELWNKRSQFSFFSDGLILAPADSPVLALRDDRLKKWKECHSIDIGLVFHGGKERRHEVILGSSPQVSSLKGGAVAIPGFPGSFEIVFVPNIVVDNDTMRRPGLRHIVECTCDITATQLIFAPIKARLDKGHGNSLRTIAATLHNIVEAVTVEELRLGAC